MCSMEGTWDGRGTDSEGRFQGGGGGCTRVVVEVGLVGCG